MIDLLQGNCLELMHNINEKSVDLIICDLPYGVTHNKADIVIPFEPLWHQYNRIIKDNGAILLFAQGLFFVDLVNSNRKMYRYDLVWNKKLTSGFLNAKKMPLRQHEQIAVFYKKLPKYNPQFTQGKPLHGKGGAYLKKGCVNNNYGEFKVLPDTRKGCTEKYPTSIVEFEKPHPSKSEHPTQKPVQLIEMLIKTYSNENDIVLDNCMGSGTTGIACLNTNRSFIGMELDNKYFQIAAQRIGKASEKFEDYSIDAEIPFEGVRK